MPKGAKKKRARKSGKSKIRRSRIDELLDLSQGTIRRYADLSSNIANKIVAGDFNVSHWVTDYSTVWSDAAEDLSRAAKIIARQPSAQGSRPSKQLRSEDVFRSWLALHQNFLHRAAEYYRSAGALVSAGSFEPQKWIESGANFWSSVTDDIGDWAEAQSGETLRPNAHWLPRIQWKLRAGKLADHVELKVPLDAFPEDGSDTTVTLKIDGLTRLGGGSTLGADQYVSFNPPRVSRSSPYAQLQLHDLPQLAHGDIYAGVVRTKETKAAIAAVIVEIV